MRIPLARIATSLAVVLFMLGGLLAAGCDRVAAPAEEPEVDAKSVALTCPIEQKNDGKFTGWPATKECAEWPEEPIKGTYGNLYMRWDEDGTLHVLNDWHLRTEPIPEGFYNLFQLTTGGGTQNWMLRVQHTRVHVWLNGKKVGAYSSGAAGFEASPTFDTPHTIYEFSLPKVAKGEFAMKLGDPGNGTFNSPEEAIVMDPKGYSGVLQTGAVAAKATDDPLIFSIHPANAKPGDTIELLGNRLGTKQGVVKVDGIDAELFGWADDKVKFKVPQLSNGLRPVQLLTGDGTAANRVHLNINCTPECANKQCGDDGCGGDCGTCEGTKLCVAGQCQCQPDCTNKVCGDDGCGGSCGTCGGGKACNGGKCVCSPQCSGKQCGDDGCGGTCGTCTGSAAKCVNNQCQCTGSCKDKACGDDGCGKSCGSCDATETCKAGVCEKK